MSESAENIENVENVDNSENVKHTIVKKKVKIVKKKKVVKQDIDNTECNENTTNNNAVNNNEDDQSVNNPVNQNDPTESIKTENTSSNNIAENITENVETTQHNTQHDNTLLSTSQNTSQNTSQQSPSFNNIMNSVTQGGVRKLTEAFDHKKTERETLKKLVNDGNSINDIKKLIGKESAYIKHELKKIAFDADNKELQDRIKKIVDDDDDKQYKSSTIEKSSQLHSDHSDSILNSNVLDLLNYMFLKEFISENSNDSRIITLRCEKRKYEEKILQSILKK